MLEISNLTVQRGNTLILDDLNWRVSAGQHWVILGGNGSGKTSLLSALTGYLTPTAGQVQLLGQSYGRADWRELRKRIGLVSSAVRQMIPEEECALETVISGRYAMIDFWGRMTKADRQHGRKLLSAVQCMPLENRPWGYLSQGERQRVLIGRALMADPALLILDEPCAGLDPAARENFLQFLQKLSLSRKAPTLILVTHHVEEIMPCFSHVLILRAGKVLAAGPRLKTLTSANLTGALSTTVKLTKQAGRYRLSLVESGQRIM